MKIKTTTKLLILFLFFSLGISACKLLQGAAFEAQGIPSDFDGLVMWLRADRGVYKDWNCSDEAFEGDEVQCWQDYSDKGNDAKKASVLGPRFTESAGDINGMPAVQFTTADASYLQTVETLPLHGTKIVVAEAFSNPGSFLFDIGGSIHIFSTAGIFAALAGGYQSDSSFVSSTAGIIVLNFDGSTVLSYVNGRLSPSSSVGYVPNGQTNYFIGVDQVNNYLDGKITEIIVFDRVLKDRERMQVEKYLSDKYDIGVSK